MVVPSQALALHQTRDGQASAGTKHTTSLPAISSGGGDHWTSVRPGFLLPVRVLSRVFRGKILGDLKAAYDAGELALVGEVENLGEPQGFRDFLGQLYRQEWVVYSKPPFAGPERVLKYLARYTHRVALSNQRLVRLEGDTVTLSWKDYRHHGRRRLLHLSTDELIRRFLQHVLPEGFVWIRYYGLVANRHRAETLERCRQLLKAPPPGDASLSTGDRQPQVCPKCGEGILKIVERIVAPHSPGPATRGRAPP